MYAYLELCRKDEFIDFMENVIKQDSLNAGNYYDGACLYSRLGDEQKAILMFKKSPELVARFAHIEHDDDLDSIRNLKEFKILIEAYRRKFNETNETEDAYRGGSSTDVSLSMV